MKIWKNLKYRSAEGARYLTRDNWDCCEWGKITQAEILAKDEVRIRAQYGNLCELQITRNISGTADGIKNQLKDWAIKEDCIYRLFGIFASFVKFRVCFCDAIVPQALRYVIIFFGTGLFFSFLAAIFA